MMEKLVEYETWRLRILGNMENKHRCKWIIRDFFSVMYMFGMFQRAYQNRCYLTEVIHKPSPRLRF